MLWSGIPDYGFARCDGHHEMVDLGSEKRPSAFADSTGVLVKACERELGGRDWIELAVAYTGIV